MTRQPCPHCAARLYPDYLPRHIEHFHAAIAHASPAVLDALLKVFQANEQPGCGGARYWLALQELRGVL